jgi:hypothetical protein
VWSAVTIALGRRDAGSLLLFAMLIGWLTVCLWLIIPGRMSLAESDRLVDQLRRWLRAEPLTKESPPSG